MLARRAGSVPVVDGDIGEWAGLNAASLNKDNASRIIGAPPGLTDLSGRLHVVWTPDRLYLAAAIADDVLIGTSGTTAPIPGTTTRWKWLSTMPGHRP